MRTTEEIYTALTEAFVAAGGAVVTEGGDMSLRLRAVAAEIFTLEAQADYVARQSFPQTACGTSLEHHAALRGLSRRAAEKAQGTLTFSCTAPGSEDIEIPEGTECRTAAGVAFVTAAAGTIAAGSTACTVAAEAVSAGAGGNVPAGTVRFPVLLPTGVTGVTNAAAFTGGCEAEEDEALRQRILNTYRTLPNGANAAYYEARVLECGGVAAVTVLPKNRGVGTVDIYFTTPAGIPTAGKQAEVQAALNAEREICTDLRVLLPTSAAVNVTAALTVAADTAFSAVSEAAEAALAAYFNGSLLGRPVNRAGLIALLMGVPGVTNCALTAPAADIAGATGTLPVLGTVSISEAV